MQNLIKIGVIIAFLTISIAALAQTNNFRLKYTVAGLGANRFKNFYPEVQIHGLTLTYQTEKNTTIKEIQKLDGFVDTIWNTKIVNSTVQLQKNTIDSIFNLVKDIKDTLRFNSNHCILGGGVCILSISNKSFRLTFELMNTFDSTALAICTILNQYLPAKHKIWEHPGFMKERKDCDIYFDKLLQEEKKKKASKTSG